MSTAPKLDCEVVVTESGAPALRDRCTGEVMHPVVGPLIEAERLYIAPSRLAHRLSLDSALATGATAKTARQEPSLVVFDVGLGAGSNAAAALRVATSSSRSTRRLTIVSFDRSTAALELALRSGRAAEFGFDERAREAAEAVLNRGFYETPALVWRLCLGELPETLSSEPAESADIVFWDPFSPPANPELWTLSAFQRLRRACRRSATVHTYSGATRVRSALLLADFAVGLGVALSADRDATVAATDAALLERPLDRTWLERLERSSAPFPCDAPRDALARIRALPQFR